MKLSKKGMYYRTVAHAGAGVFALAVVFPPAIVLVPFILLATGIYEYFYWKKFEFFFEDNDLKIRSGVITRNELDIPVRRIQDIDIQKNIIHRALGITKVNVKTAGGDTSKAALKYLDEGQAEQVREELRRLKNRHKEREKTGERTDGETFYDIKDALMTYSLVSGVQGVAAVGLLLSIAGIGLSSYAATSTIEMAGFSVAALLLAASASVFVLLSSAASTYSRYYDFRVEKKGDTFEYERGLFNKQGGSIPEEKIQKLEISENFLMRWFGYATLKAETAGYTSSQDQGTTSTQVLIPLDTREQVYKHAEKLGEISDQKIQNITHESRRRYFRRYTGISTIGLVTVSVLVYLGFNPGLLFLPVIGFLASKKASGLKWANIGYSLGERNLMVMKGFWNRRTYIVPYFRSQNLMVSESVFQRRWGLASLTVDTAGDKVINPQIVDLDRDRAFQIREEIYQKFKDSIY
ncbi:MAG: PH domain-containing protein [Candidatus Nanohaloarchaea archaeon]